MKSFVLKLWRINSVILGVLILGLIISQFYSLTKFLLDISLFYIPEELSYRFLRIFHIIMYGYLGILVGLYINRFIPLYFNNNQIKIRLSIYSLASILSGIFIGVWTLMSSFNNLFPGIIYFITLIWTLLASKNISSDNKILFLRRFSNDYIIYGAVKRTIPKTKQLICLIPENEPIANWDPVHSTIAGLNIMKPIKNTTVFLISKEEHWVGNIKYLLNHPALHIILDLSQISDSIKTEIKIIHELNLFHKMILIYPESNRDEVRSVLTNLKSNNSEQFNDFQYKKTWKTSIYQIFNSLFLFALISTVLFFIGTKSILSISISLYVIISLGSSLFVYSFKPGLNAKFISNLKAALKTRQYHSSKGLLIIFKKIKNYFFPKYDDEENYVRKYARAFNYLLVTLIFIYLSHDSWFIYGPFWVISVWFSLDDTIFEESLSLNAILRYLCIGLPIILIKALSAIR